MQDRYFGDVGDFGKYGLLRVLCGLWGGPNFKLGVVWYLFPDENHNADGIFLQIKRHAANAAGEFHQLARLHFIQAINDGNSIADGNHLANFIKLRARIKIGDLFFYNFRNFCWWEECVKMVLEKFCYFPKFPFSEI